MILMKLSGNVDNGTRNKWFDFVGSLCCFMTEDFCIIALTAILELLGLGLGIHSQRALVSQILVEIFVFIKDNDFFVVSMFIFFSFCSKYHLPIYIF